VLCSHSGVKRKLNYVPFVVGVGDQRFCESMAQGVNLSIDVLIAVDCHGQLTEQRNAFWYADDVAEF
jgi:hypothetical protein